MELKERVLEYIVKRWEEDGLETKTRIYSLARNLHADRNDVLLVINELLEDGVIEYHSSPNESHICPVVSEDELLKKKVVNLVKEIRRTNGHKISKLLVEDRSKIGQVTSTLVDEGKIKVAGDGEMTWLEPA